MSYKKVRTVFINDKKKVIYMKPKGTREYVKSKGEMVLLTSYLKKVEKVAAKKAMASKLAKKSPKVKRSTKYVRRGGFFFTTNDTAPTTQQLSINPPGGVGIGGTMPPTYTTMNPSNNASKLPTTYEMNPSNNTPPNPSSTYTMNPSNIASDASNASKSSSNSAMGEPPRQAGGYYNVDQKLIGNTTQIIGQIMDQLNDVVKTTGGKKGKKGKRVVKKETNPFKNFMNTLALKKKRRKGKKRGGYSEEDGDREVW